jgi:hypothetical protein
MAPRAFQPKEDHFGVLQDALHASERHLQATRRYVRAVYGMRATVRQPTTKKCGFRAWLSRTPFDAGNRIATFEARWLQTGGMRRLMLRSPISQCLPLRLAAAVAPSRRGSWTIQSLPGTIERVTDSGVPSHWLANSLNGQLGSRRLVLTSASYHGFIASWFHGFMGQLRRFRKLLLVIHKELGSKGHRKTSTGNMKEQGDSVQCAQGLASLCICLRHASCARSSIGRTIGSS